MFKKLVVGALAAGIALTGGIGAASASTENARLLGCVTTGVSDYGNGLYGKEVYNTTNSFANSFTEDGIRWYFKNSYKANENCGGYYAHYEGRKI
ncbi:LCI family antimicrobial peptide [Bacillus cereus]|nr:LCI family antimicrobial peptide [Bacillus cereus]